MFGFWILLLLLLLLIALIPAWPYSGEWGYGPAGAVFALLVVWLLFVWFGMIAFAWPWAAATVH